MSYQAEIQKAIRDFPDFPVGSQRILQLINEPEVDYEELEKAMRYDPGLTANVLRLVNSAQFGVKRTIESLHRAFVLLGEKRIFELVMTHVSSKLFDVEMRGYQLQPQDFLRHSLWVAVGAEQFAKTLDLQTSETLFTAGLLHDVGKLVMDPFLVQERETMQAVAADVSEDSFEQREKAVFGINHNEAGAMLFEHWNLPPEIAAAIRYHHTPEDAPDHQQLVKVVHIADMQAYVESVGTGIEGVHYHLSQQAFEDLDLAEETVEYVASQTVDQMKEIMQLLETQ